MARDDFKGTVAFEIENSPDSTILNIVTDADIVGLVNGSPRTTFANIHATNPQATILRARNSPELTAEDIRVGTPNFLNSAFLAARDKIK